MRRIDTICVPTIPHHIRKQCVQSRLMLYGLLIRSASDPYSGMHSNSFHLLSARWRIYPSSKWSSQWPYDGYIRRGWTTSCGRGRDSATRECFGRGSRGTIFRSKLESISFLSRVMSVSKSFFFCFPRFRKIWRETFKLWGFWFRRCLGGLFENSAPSPGIFFFCELRFRPRVFFENFLFSKAQLVLLDWQLWRSPGWAKNFGDGTSKTRMKTGLPDVARSCAEGPSIVIAIGTSRVRWSMV